MGGDDPKEWIDCKALCCSNSNVLNVGLCLSTVIQCDASLKVPEGGRYVH